MDGSTIFLENKNVTRNRAAIEVNTMKKLKILKVALRPSGVFLVSQIFLT